jgi:hypothetical protein
MRSNFATHNLLAVSALLRETAINTEQTLDSLLKVDLASILKYARRTESDEDEATGYEEGTMLYDLGALGSLPFVQSKAKPHDVALIGGFGLGAVSTAVAGTGYKHTITPIPGDLDDSRSVPSMTAAMRMGKQLLTHRLASLFVNNFSLSFERDSWLKVEADMPSTGKRSTNIYEETVNAAYNADHLDLAANEIDGATAAERLNNVHAVKVQVPATSQWVDVVCTAASDADPAILTITPPGVAATLCDYKILYNIKAEAPSYAWADFSALNFVSESPLRVSDFLVKIGGKWDGTTLLGGHTVQADINSLKWSFNNNLKVEFTPGAGSGAYANRALRDGRTQTLSFDRKFADYIMGNYADLREYFVFYAIAEGAVYDTPHKYTVELILPRVAVMSCDPKLDGKRLSEPVEIKVLEDPTYGSAILNVKNKQATYAA